MGNENGGLSNRPIFCDEQNIYVGSGVVVGPLPMLLDLYLRPPPQL